jgi:hypothetical protein
VPEPYLVWALVAGMVIGGGVVWFIVGRLPRRDRTADPAGLRGHLLRRDVVQATRGGAAPPDLVEEVLQLHLDYVAGEPAHVEPEPERRA